MKKIVLLLLSISILICLVACNLGQNQVPTPEHTHSFGEWSVSKNATCTEDGVKVRYCDCGEKQSEVIPTLEHTYNTTYSFDNSFHWYSCTGCGAKKDRAEHQATDDGMCTVCGATEGIIYDI